MSNRRVKVGANAYWSMDVSRDIWRASNEIYITDLGTGCPWKRCEPSVRRWNLGSLHQCCRNFILVPTCWVIQCWITFFTPFNNNRTILILLDDRETTLARPIVWFGSRGWKNATPWSELPGLNLNILAEPVKLLIVVVLTCTPHGFGLGNGCFPNPNTT